MEITYVNQKKFTSGAERLRSDWERQRQIVLGLCKAFQLKLPTHSQGLYAHLGHPSQLQTYLSSVLARFYEKCNLIKCYIVIILNALI